MLSIRAAMISLAFPCLCVAVNSNETDMHLATLNASAEVSQWQKCQARIKKTAAKYNITTHMAAIDEVCRAISFVEKRKSTPPNRFLGASRGLAPSTWTDLGDQLGDLEWDSIKWGEKDPKTGEQSDLSTYGTFLAGTMYTVGAIEAGVIGDWGTFWKGLGQTAVGLTSLIPEVGPFLSMGLSFFMSFFSSSDGIGEEINEAFQKLYKKIMEEVKTMISDQAIASALAQSQISVASCADRLSRLPTELPMPQPMSEEGYYIYKLTWWDTTENNFLEGFRTVFGASVGCLDCPSCGAVHVRPATSKTSACKKYQEQGAFNFQFNFALMHLSVLVEQARLAPLQDRLPTLRAFAGMYHDLLKDSLDTWRAGYSFTCSYSYGKCWGFDVHASGKCNPVGYRPTGIFWQPDQCCNPLNSLNSATLDNPIQPNTGMDITCEMDCKSSVQGSEEGTTSPCGTPRGGACSDADFSKFNELYMKNIGRKYQPLLNSVQALSKPLQMKEAIDSIVKRGQQGVQDDVDTSKKSKSVQARRDALYKACEDQCSNSKSSFWQDVCVTLTCMGIKTAQDASIPSTRCACRAQYCSNTNIFTATSCEAICNALPGVFDQ